MSEFFAMGGYAVYVWPSFVLTAVVMFANLYFARRHRGKVIAKLQQDGLTKKPAQKADSRNV